MNFLLFLKQKIFKDYSFFESFVFASGFFLLVGSVLWQKSFASIGIPLSLSAFWGTIDFFSFRIFISEIFLLTLLGFVLFLAPKDLYSFKKCYGAYLLFLIMSFSFLRLLPDLSENFVLGVRNASFAWYLLLPLVLSTHKIRAEVLERVAKMLLIFVFFHYLIYWTGGGTPLSIQEKPANFVSIYAFLALYLFTSNVYCLYALFFTFVFGFSQELLVEKISRTQWFGIVIVILSSIFITKQYAQYNKVLRRIFSLSACVFVIVFTSYFLNSRTKSLNETWQIGDRFSEALSSRINRTKLSNLSNKVSDILSVDLLVNFGSFLLKKAEKADSNKYGLEVFRFAMWGDAFHLFKENPFIGIGFQKQVVYRVYQGNGRFVPNVAMFRYGKMASPISGPHNSYLNALARIGVFGFLFIVLYLWAGYILFQHKLYGSFFLVFGGAIYALFNVGLEIPYYSICLLFGLGVALNVERRNSLVQSYKKAKI